MSRESTDIFFPHPPSLPLTSFLIISPAHIPDDVKIHLLQEIRGFLRNELDMVSPDTHTKP
jgi:hypothetical protein